MKAPSANLPLTTAPKGNAPRPIDTAELLPNPVLRKLYRPFRPLVETAFGFPAMWKLYDEAGGDSTTGPQLAKNTLRLLRSTWTLDPLTFRRLKNFDGPLVIAANHPFGGLDSLALIDLLDALRPGRWRLLSNHVLKAMPPFAPYLIPVDALGFSGEGHALNRRAMRTALKHLRDGGVLALFPAKRVSHFDPKINAVVDQPWSDHALKLAARTGAALAVLHTPGANRPGFLRIPLSRPRLRGLALCREITQSPPRRLDFRLADWFSPEGVRKISRHPAATAKLRAHCFLQADLRHAPATPARAPAAPTLPMHAGAPTAEIFARAARSPRRPEILLFSKHQFDTLFFRGDQAPELLQAIGAAREETFSRAGQGVGRPVDLSPEDAYYHHLLVWDRRAQAPAGAYRLGVVPEILRHRGPAGLYLANVFQIRAPFFEHLGNALELSRSFVRPPYQKDSPILSILWQGLARVSLKFESRTLFGSVTISNNFHPMSRAILVEHLRRRYADSLEFRKWVRPGNPFTPSTSYHSLVADAYREDPIGALNPLIRKIEAGNRTIPPLIRYYCSLGARFIGFHVEPAFRDALYCLLRVDLQKIPSAYRRRFFP